MHCVHISSYNNCLSHCSSKMYTLRIEQYILPHPTVFDFTTNYSRCRALDQVTRTANNCSGKLLTCTISSNVIVGWEFHHLALSNVAYVWPIGTPRHCMLYLTNSWTESFEICVIRRTGIRLTTKAWIRIVPEISGMPSRVQSGNQYSRKLETWTF